MRLTRKYAGICHAVETLVLPCEPLAERVCTRHRFTHKSNRKRVYESSPCLIVLLWFLVTVARCDHATNKDDRSTTTVHTAIGVYQGISRRCGLQSSGSRSKTPHSPGRREHDWGCAAGTQGEASAEINRREDGSRHYGCQTHGFIALRNARNAGFSGVPHGCCGRCARRR